MAKTDLSRWTNRLPTEVLTTILASLNLRDRYNAALVCKSWAEAVRHPAVWRMMRCGFYGDSFPIQYDWGPTCNQVQSLSLALHHGHQLRWIQIYGEAILSEENFLIKKKMTTFFKRLLNVGCQLTHLHLWGFCFCDWQGKDCDDLLISIAHFLRSQTRLVFFRMSWSLPLHYGAIILQTLAINCTNVLEQLHLTPGFDAQLHVYRSNVCKSGLEHWYCLKYVSVHYNAMNDEVLLALTRPHTLHCLTVEFTKWCDRDHVIRPLTWKKAKTSCPNLEVKFKVADLPEFEVVRPFLPVEVPLVSLSFFTGNNKEKGTQWNLNGFLYHITYSFFTTLESVQLILTNANTDIDMNLLEMIITCRKLKEVELYAEIKIRTLEAILNYQASNKIALSKLHVNLLHLSEEEKKELASVELRHSNLIESPKLDFFCSIKPTFVPILGI